MQGFVRGGTQLGNPPQLTYIPPRHALMPPVTTIAQPTPVTVSAQPRTNAYPFDYGTNAATHVQQSPYAPQTQALPIPPISTHMQVPYAPSTAATPIPPIPTTGPHIDLTHERAAHDTQGWGHEYRSRAQQDAHTSEIGKLPNGRPRYTRASRGKYQFHPDVPAEWHAWATYFEYQKPDTPILMQEKLFREPLDTRSWPKHAILKGQHEIPDDG
jgi:hypothetical protein